MYVREIRSTLRGIFKNPIHDIESLLGLFLVKETNKYSSLFDLLCYHINTRNQFQGYRL